MYLKKAPSLISERAQVQGGFHLRDNRLKEVLVVLCKVVADFPENTAHCLCSEAAAFEDAIFDIVRVDPTCCKVV